MSTSAAFTAFPLGGFDLDTSPFLGVVGYAGLSVRSMTRDASLDTVRVEGVAGREGETEGDEVEGEEEEWKDASSPWRRPAIKSASAGWAGGAGDMAGGCVWRCEN